MVLHIRNCSIYAGTMGGRTRGPLVRILSSMNWNSPRPDWELPIGWKEIPTIHSSMHLLPGVPQGSQCWPPISSVIRLWKYRHWFCSLIGECSVSLVYQVGLITPHPSEPHGGLLRLMLLPPHGAETQSPCTTPHALSIVGFPPTPRHNASQTDTDDDEKIDAGERSSGVNAEAAMLSTMLQGRSDARCPGRA